MGKIWSRSFIWFKISGNSTRLFLILPAALFCVCLFSEGNFGDRYFGTDAPSDWCESDEGMDFWRRDAAFLKHLEPWRDTSLFRQCDRRWGRWEYHSSSQPAGGRLSASTSARSPAIASENRRNAWFWCKYQLQLEVTSCKFTGRAFKCTISLFASTNRNINHCRAGLSQSQARSQSSNASQYLHYQGQNRRATAPIRILDAAAVNRFHITIVGRHSWGRLIRVITILRGRLQVQTSIINITPIDRRRPFSWTFSRWRGSCVTYLF